MLITIFQIILYCVVVGGGALLIICVIETLQEKAYKKSLQEHAHVYTHRRKRSEWADGVTMKW